MLYDAAVTATALLDGVPADERGCAHHELAGLAHDALVTVTPSTAHRPDASPPA